MFGYKTCILHEDDSLLAYSCVVSLEYWHFRDAYHLHHQDDEQAMSERLAGYIWIGQTKYSCTQTQHQPGPYHPTPRHQDPIHQIQIQGLDDQHGHWDWAASKQHYQGGWPLPEPVMETPHPLSQRMQKPPTSAVSVPTVLRTRTGLSVLSLLAHPRVTSQHHPSDSPVGLKRAHFHPPPYLSLYIHNTSLSFTAAHPPFYHWLASSPDCHPFAHWSAQVTLGPTDSYISSNLPLSLFITLTMEAVYTSEMSVYSDKTTWCYIAEGSHHHIRHHEKPEISHVFCKFKI
jgi:hypothetical protein